MDYAIKFWDIRNLNSPVSGIFNNSHWVWKLKYNKTYSRILMTSSSSSLVRGYIFESDSNDGNIEHGLSNLNFKNYNCLDYLEFEDSVYDFDWANNDPWIFSAISYNGHLHINIIPDEIKYKIMIY